MRLYVARFVEGALPEFGKRSAESVHDLWGRSGGGGRRAAWLRRNRVALSPAGAAPCRSGYAALLIDSFGPRGFPNVCNQGLLVPPETQARDAFDGAAYLRASPQVRAQRVGVIGFSHGGWAVLKVVLAGLVRRPNEPAFAAAVAFYPGCDPRDPPGRPLETDTLILIGDADDWTPAARCAKWRNAVQTHGHVLQMKTYPAARHGFDAPRPPHFYAGHYVGQDPASLADSLIKTRQFFDQRLIAQH